MVSLIALACKQPWLSVRKRTCSSMCTGACNMSKWNVRDEAGRRDAATGRARLKNRELLSVLTQWIEFSAFLPSDMEFSTFWSSVLGRMLANVEETDLNEPQMAQYLKKNILDSNGHLAAITSSSFSFKSVQQNQVWKPRLGPRLKAVRTLEECIYVHHGQAVSEQYQPVTLVTAPTPSKLPTKASNGCCPARQLFAILDSSCSKWAMGSSPRPKVAFIRTWCMPLRRHRKACCVGPEKKQQVLLPDTADDEPETGSLQVGSDAFWEACCFQLKHEIEAACRRRSKSF